MGGGSTWAADEFMSRKEDGILVYQGSVWSSDDRIHVHLRGSPLCREGSWATDRKGLISSGKGGTDVCVCGTLM